MALFGWNSPAVEMAMNATTQPRVQASQSLADLSPYQIMKTGGMHNVTVGDAWAYPVSRELALSVPALRRGLEVVCATIAGFPMRRRDAAGNRIALGWLEQPEPDRPRFNTIFDTLLDLKLASVAYWYIHERDSNGQPARGGVEYISLDRVSVQEYKLNGQIQRRLSIDGIPVSPVNVIGFEGLGNGIMVDGARLIRTALALEAAAKRYADSPLPSLMLANESGYELTDEEIDAAVEDVKTMRNQEGIGYRNAGFKLETMGWDSAQLQLVEARQFTNTQMANLAGVPVRMIAGASAASGGMVTYANVTQDNRELVDYGLKPLTNVVEARLSMTDAAGATGQNRVQVTPRGQTVEFDMDNLLRGNPLERAELYEKLIPLGVLTVEQAQLWEDLAEGRAL